MEEALNQVNEELRNLVQQIEKVKEEKKNCTSQLEAEYLWKELEHLWETENHLRKKEEQLRKKEEQLRKKEEQLREEQLLLLQQERPSPPTPKRFRRGQSPYRVAQLSASKSISLFAKEVDCLNDLCEDQPIFVHWFGLELLRAYESAKQQVEQGKNPISLKLESDTYEIERNSLEMATAAIEVAATLSKGTSAPELRGFRGFHEVQRTEVAFTSLACRALDRFLFSDQAVGACLHQAPCRKRTNNPERPDMYIVPFPEKDFNPGEPAVLSDWKLSGNEFDLANRESVLYSLAGTLTEEGCKFPVLIGIPATSDMMELQLHVNIHDTLCKLVVANGKPWDGALLCTLKASIDHLFKNSFFTSSIPPKLPVPFKDMTLYTFLGERKRVFYKQVEETVCKFFDTRSDDFFHPDILQCLIKKLKLLPKMKLTPPYTQDVRLYTLTYTFVKANGRQQHKLKAFVGVIQQLSEMHSAGFVHGDIRLANMVFSGDNDSHLIDFDFVGKPGFTTL